MANEVRGILFETITSIALEKAKQIAGNTSQIFWNEKPADMSIRPDFTIGENKDAPTHIFLVTASGSAKETDKKFWRNAGELQEIKAQLHGAPAVINLYFKSVIKAGLGKVSQFLYDTTLHVDEKPYSKHLDAWVMANLKNAAKTKEARRKLLQADLKKNPKLAEAGNKLADDLADALQGRNSELDGLWNLMRADYQAAKLHPVPVARNTSIRRGLGKLLVLDPATRQIVYTNYQKKTPIRESLPEYVFDLGFFNKAIGRSRLVDNDIKGALDLLGPAKCETVLLQRAPASMKTWFIPLQNLHRLVTHVEFIEDHYDDVTNPDKLRNLLVQCYQDPAGLSGESSDEKVWVFEIMISLLKAKSGKLQGYGLAQLAVDTTTPEFGQGGFLIPPFAQREKMLSPAHLDALATGLANRFKQDIAKTDLPTLKDTVKDWVIKENLEDRLIPYRNFEPLLWLLEAELQVQGKASISIQKTPYPGWINEYADSSRNSATTPFVKVGKTLIHWKSVSDAGKVHKKKELSARARAVKYQYNPASKTFTHRQGVERLVLIVDGTFDDDDLRVLTDSGWDIICYPDEISALVSNL